MQDLLEPHQPVFFYPHGLPAFGVISAYSPVEPVQMLGRFSLIVGIFRASLREFDPCSPVADPAKGRFATQKSDSSLYKIGCNRSRESAYPRPVGTIVSTDKQSCL